MKDIKTFILSKKAIARMALDVLKLFVEEMEQPKNTFIVAIESVKGSGSTEFWLLRIAIKLLLILSCNPNGHKKA